MIRYICLLILLSLCACANRPKDDQEIRVSVLRGPSVIAFAGWLDNPPLLNGKRMRVEILDSPDLVQASLIKGESDIAVLPMINATNLYNKGIDIKLAGCPIWGTLYLVEKEGAKGNTLHVFGSGTTPDILTRHYLERQNPDFPAYTLNYAFHTAREIAQGILAGKVERAVLGEPFLSLALREDTTLRILADLNNPEGKPSTEATFDQFAQTAIVYMSRLEKERIELDSLLAQACLYATSQPVQSIQQLEAHKIFAPGMITPQSIERCKILYRPANEAQGSILQFLRIIHQYEPKAIGGKLPDDGFISSIP